LFLVYAVLCVFEQEGCKERPLPTSFDTEEGAMITEKVDGLAGLHKQVEAVDKDLLREMVQRIDVDGSRNRQYLWCFVNAGGIPGLG
jgi:hypothetical protein